MDMKNVSVKLSGAANSDLFFSSAAKPEASSVAEQSKTECMDTSACSEDICPANQVWYGLRIIQ